MTKEEFAQKVQRCIDLLGTEAVMFFVILKKMEEFFIKSDEEFMGVPLLLHEIEEIGNDIMDVLGEEDGKQFFKAIYDTLPTETIWYLSILVKLMEIGGKSSKKTQINYYSDDYKEEQGYAICLEMNDEKKQRNCINFKERDQSYNDYSKMGYDTKASCDWIDHSGACNCPWGKETKNG
jgi:hypothetical protein